MSIAYSRHCTLYYTNPTLYCTELQYTILFHHIMQHYTVLLILHPILSHYNKLYRMYREYTYITVSILTPSHLSSPNSGLWRTHTSITPYPSPNSPPERIEYSSFNTIQPLLLWGNKRGMQIDTMVSWVTDYLLNRLQLVTLGTCLYFH